MSDDPGKAERNLKRVAQLAEYNIAIEDVLSAHNFIHMNTGHNPSFEEALGLCRDLKARYPQHNASECFEAGIVAIETGFHERPELSDLPDFAERIFAGIKDN